MSDDASRTDAPAPEPEPAAPVTESLSPADLRPDLLRKFVWAAMLGQAAAFYAVRQDDPFITYRYGQNLVEGHGLVFNVGERILGSTAPGHMLLSALVYAIFGRENTPSIMSLLGCLAWTAQALAAYRLLLPVLGRSRSVAITFALLLGAARTFMWVPFETNLVSASALWAFVALREGRFVAAAALCGIATLLRPDAMIVSVVIGAACLWRERARAWRPVLVFLAVLLPWVVFATLYYGSPLPQSAVTKFQRTDFFPYLGHIVGVVGETLVPFARSPLVFLTAWAVALVGAVRLVRRDHTLALYVLYVVLHGAAYLYLRPFVGHDWHLYPLQLGGTICALSAIALVSREALLRPVRIAASVFLVGLALASALRTGGMAMSFKDDYWTGDRHGVYLHLARYLKENMHPGDAFASVEVGTLAYYTGMRVFDMGGLVTDTTKVSSDRAVRWLVLDVNYYWTAPPWPVQYAAGGKRFKAYVWKIPEGKTLTFPRVETLPPNRREAR